MQTFENEKKPTAKPGVSHSRVIIIALLVGLFGLLMGTLIHPAEAYQGFEIRLSTVERKVDTLQFSFSSMDRRVSMLENRSYTPSTTTTTQPTQTESGSVLEGQRLLNNRIDELQTQLQNQQKMIVELHKMIDEKQKPDDKKTDTKKPATTNPKP